MYKDLEFHLNELQHNKPTNADIDTFENANISSMSFLCHVSKVILSKMTVGQMKTASALCDQVRLSK